MAVPFRGHRLGYPGFPTKNILVRSQQYSGGEKKNEIDYIIAHSRYSKPFSDSTIGETGVKVTILRDPVSLFYSSFGYRAVLW